MRRSTRVVNAFVALAMSVSAAQAQGSSILPPPSTNTKLSVDRVVAVVGTHPILYSEALEQVNQRRAAGQPMPTDSVGQAELLKQIISDLVDEELLVEEADREKIVVSDADVARTVDDQMTKIRAQFRTDSEFRAELVKAGFGNLEEYRKSIADQARRAAVQQQLVSKLREDGKLVSPAVSERQVSDAFEKNRSTLPHRPATVTFRQVIVSPQPSAPALEVARVKAESLLAEIRRGGDFEQIARRSSMDEQTRETGGDLGWNRRGVMVPEFDRVMFGLPPGVVSNVVHTPFGFHIIRVDRVQPAEVKVRHILIRPVIDSADIAAAHLRADSVAQLWRAGTPFDTLVARYHDTREEKLIPDPFDMSQLPQSYRDAFAGKGVNDIVDPFQIEDPRSGIPKFVVAQVITMAAAGEYTVADLRQSIRDQLAQEGAIRKYLDSLKKHSYVAIFL